MNAFTETLEFKLDDNQFLKEVLSMLKIVDEQTVKNYLRSGRNKRQNFSDPKNGLSLQFDYFKDLASNTTGTSFKIEMVKEQSNGLYNNLTSLLRENNIPYKIEGKY